MIIKIFITIILFLTTQTQVGFSQENLDLKNQPLKSLINWSSNLAKGSGIKVAVIDSGLIDHYPGNISQGWNFVDNNSNFIDLSGHGTGSASVIHTLAPEVEIMPLKATSNGVASHKNIVYAIVYAIKNNARIINLSLTFDDETIKKLKAFITDKELRETLFITAAGNENTQSAQILSENVINVGATTLQAPVKLTSYSNWGNSVDIAAPAGAPYDGIVVYKTAYPQVIFRKYNGTSAAAPVITAVAAMIKEKFPEISPIQIKSLILEKAAKVSSLKNKVKDANFLDLSFLQ